MVSETMNIHGFGNHEYSWLRKPWIFMVCQSKKSNFAKVNKNTFRYLYEISSCTKWFGVAQSNSLYVAVQASQLHKSHCWRNKLSNTQRKMHGKYMGHIYQEYIKNIHKYLWYKISRNTGAAFGGAPNGVCVSDYLIS